MLLERSAMVTAISESLYCFSSLELTWKPSCQPGKVITLKNAGCPKDKQLGPTMLSLCFLGSRVPSPHLQSAPFLPSASFPPFSSPNPYTLHQLSKCL